MRRLTAVLSLVMLSMILASPAATAQAAKPKLTTHQEGTLGKLAAYNLGNMSGDQSCGDYFRFSGVPAEKGKVGVVTFVYVMKDPNERVTNVTIPLMGSDKLEIHVVPGKNTPTAKMVRTGGPIYPYFVIEISPADFAGAPCLKHSKVIGA